MVIVLCAGFASRRNIEDVQEHHVSPIPIHPVSYDTARHLFKAMDPQSPPLNVYWKVTPCYTYRYQSFLYYAIVEIKTYQCFMCKWENAYIADKFALCILCILDKTFQKSFYM